MGDFQDSSTYILEFDSLKSFSGPKTNIMLNLNKFSTIRQFSYLMITMYMANQDPKTLSVDPKTLSCSPQPFQDPKLGFLKFMIFFFNF